MRKAMHRYLYVLFLLICLCPGTVLGQEAPEQELRRADDLVMKAYEQVFINQDYTGARQCLTGAIEIYKRLKGTSDPQYLDAVYGIGDACERQKEYAAALEWFTEYAKNTTMNQVRTYGRIGLLCGKMNRLEQAVEYYKKGIALFESGNVSWNSDVKNVYDYLGDLYNMRGDYQGALAIYKKQLDCVEKYKENETLYTTVLNNIGLMYHQLGEENRALECYNRCIQILSENHLLDKESRTYSALVNNMGMSYDQLGDYVKARACYTNALEINERLFGRTHPEYAISLNNVGLACEKMGDYAAAAGYVSQAMEIYASIYGYEHPEYARSCSNLGFIYEARGEYARAMECCTKAVEIYGRILGENHPDYAAALKNLGSVHFSKGDYAAAGKYYKQVADVERSAFGEQHPSYALSLNNIGAVYSSLGHYSKALENYRQAAEIIRTVLGRQHSAYALSLNNIGGVYQHMGNYSEALDYFNQAAAIERAVLGEQNISYANTLNNIGTVYNDLGNYSEALKYYNEVSEIEHRVLGKSHPSYARTLNNIGAVYGSLGNYSEALKYYNQAAEIIRVARGEDHPDYAIVMNNIGQIYNLSGDYSQALKYYQRAAEIKYILLGGQHPGYAVSLYHIAAIYNADGLWQEAEECLRRARTIYEEASLTNTLQYASILNNLAHACEGTGHQKEALNLYEQCADIYAKIVGTRYPDYLLARNNIGLMALFSGDFSRAAVHMKVVFDGVKENMRNHFSYLAETERVFYWNQQQLMVQNMLALSAGSVDGPVASLLYDVSLLNKGLLLSTGLELEKIIRESGDPELLVEYDRLRLLRHRLMKLSESPENVDKGEMDSLGHIASGLEHAILDRSREFGDYTRNTAIGWSDVQRSLSGHDVAVEFISYGYGPDTLYDALVLRRGWKAPKRVKLCSEADFRRHKVTAQNTAVYDNPDALYDYTWKRLEEYISENENVYFALSGNLYQIGMEYLPSGIDGQRMCDKYNMLRVSSTRELALTKNPDVYRSARLYGGLNYNTNVDDMLLHATDYDSRRGFHNRLGIISDVKLTTWGYLKGTRREVEQINRTLAGHQYTTAVCMGDEGVEESFKALSGRKTGIIHVATHGFYLPGKKRPGTRGLILDKRQVSGEDESLLRTGLVFSGANNVWVGQSNIPEEIDDGILTAKEISLLDLRGTELVVLSACQTGLGEVTGEGVFGLQRAFKKAGVQTLLVSLWDVNDEATEVMMTAFYKAFSAGETKRAAFRMAQQEVKEHTFMLDGKQQSGANPYFWASFVMLD